MTNQVDGKEVAQHNSREKGVWIVVHGMFSKRSGCCQSFHTEAEMYGGPTWAVSGWDLSPIAMQTLLPAQVPRQT